MSTKRQPTKKRRPAARQTAPRHVVIRATVAGIAPAVWRLVRVPEEYSLHQLHRVLQLVFGWLDYHLYEFRVAGNQIEGPHPEAAGRSTMDVLLRDLELKARSRLDYFYDYGDGWEHNLEVVDFLPMPSSAEFDWSPRLLDGARAGPLEDSGGPHGYSRVVAALLDPSHPDHSMYRAWAGPTYDPARFDLWAIDHALALATAWGAV